MSARIIIVGKTFGRVKVIAEAEPSFLPSGQKELRCLCRCECGKEFVTKERYVRIGWTTSCGCTKAERIGALNRTHGKSRTRTYRIWSNMLQRCTNPRNPKYADYGARGIKVCPEWRFFEEFLRDMGEAPNGLTIDRIDNDKGYSHDNCQWGTPIQQARNTRRNIVLTINGTTATLPELCEQFHVSYDRTRQRLYAGWNTERAFQPGKKHRFRK